MAGRRRDHHGRRARCQWRAASAAAGVHRPRRFARSEASAVVATGSPSGWKRSTATSVVGSRPASEASATRPAGSVSLMFSSHSKASSAVTMTPERQWMPLKGRCPPPWTATMLPAARSTSGGVLGECEKGATGFDHNCLSEEECTVAIWHRRELPSTGQMAGFRNWPLHRKNSQGREARPPTDWGPAKSPASHGRRTTLRPALRGEEPAACEPGQGGRGGGPGSRNLVVMAM